MSRPSGAMTRIVISVKISPFTFTLKYDAECAKCFAGLKPGAEAGYVGKWIYCQGCLKKAVLAQRTD